MKWVMILLLGLWVYCFVDYNLHMSDLKAFGDVPVTGDMLVTAVRALGDRVALWGLAVVILLYGLLGDS